jgi:anaerobic magnesium-protoporphyrin IX monomethyl ester cyclase
LHEDNFNFLSKMCLSRMREAACHMSEMAREGQAVVIAGGADVTDHPELYFAHGVQYALFGEPDHTLIELLDALNGRPTNDQRPTTNDRLTTEDRGSKIEDRGSRIDNPRSSILDLRSANSSIVHRRIREIAGLALPDPDAPGGVYRTTKRPPERHPDIFPFPAWDLVDIEPYRAAWVQAHGYFSLNMVSTRGCPFHCNWCAKPIWGQRYAMRSPANVAEELALVKRTLRPDHIWFADDIFGLRPQWVAEFGREVAARDAAIPFMIQSRVDLLTEQAVAGLAQAGCAEVWMGAESGSQKILDAMDKGTKIHQIAAARARLKAAGIRACFFIQFGYPGETFEDIMATVQLVRDNMPDNIGVSVSYPLPGTRFHEMVKEQLGAKTNWVDSNDLAMMFQGTYQSPFYRKLHQVLHQDLELHQRIADCRLQISDWDETTTHDLQSAIDDLNADWLELGRLEVLHRSAAPTLLARPYDQPVAPDLSQEWN